MATIKRLKRGTTTVWEMTVKENGAAKQVDTATAVVFYMRLLGSTTNKIDGKACTVIDDGTSPLRGRVNFAPIGADTDTKGVYQGYFKVTFADGKFGKFPDDNKGVPGVDGDFSRIEISSDFE